MSAQLSPEEAVRKFFDCYTNGRPEDFDQCVAPGYVDYGHEPPGIGPAGARADYENAVRMASGLITYTIDALSPTATWWQPTGRARCPAAPPFED
jgi:hypothetical protein